MGIGDMFKASEYKERAKANERRVSELESEVERLRSQLTPEIVETAKSRGLLDKLRSECESLSKQVVPLREKVAELKKQATETEQLIDTFEDEILVEDFGLYRPRFDFAESSQFKDALAECRAEQREAIKAFKADASDISWTVNGSKAEGRKLVNDTARLLMTAFNSECDDIVRKVKALNIEKSIDRIRKLAEKITRLGRTMHIRIPDHYVDLKVKEAQLAYEFARQKEKEKEELREAREREREAKKLAQEIAQERKRLDKERKQYQTAYDDVMKRLEKADGEEAQELEKKAEELREKLADVERATQDVDYREANQKAGYVYVISNVGSFGEGVYKIGMTRRLDPMERVSELSDASVPFNFDVHALIFCDDAPALEAALHRAFETKKVNLVNQRREFFRVTLEEIEDVVKRNYDKTVEFHETPDADQFRVSEKMREKGIYHL